MVRLVNGFAGSGKTMTALEEAYTLIEAQELKPESVLFLTLTPLEKNKLMEINKSRQNSKNLTIWSFENLLNYIFKKSPSSYGKKVVSDFFATNLIGAICKDKFKSNFALLNLTKSNTFFRELYNLFGLFKNNEISSIVLSDIISSAEISRTDKERLELVIAVFNSYNDILNSNNYLDYRDVNLEAEKALEQNKILLETIKSRFSHIFVDGCQDLTYLQFKLIKLLIRQDNATFYGDDYSRIQEFRGAWKDSLNIDILRSNFNKFEHFELTVSKRNSEIFERAICFVKKYCSEDVSCDFKESDSIKYKMFEDIQSEISSIAKDIKHKVDFCGCQFSDFAILIRDYEAKQKIIDLFKTQGIPINSELYNQKYQNFKYKLSKYLNICETLDKLGVKTFDRVGLINDGVTSKADKEILYEELNLYVENLLPEVLEDIYAKERFLSMQDESKNISLLDVVWKNLDLLKIDDKKRLDKLFLKISQIYEMFKSENFVALTLYVAKSEFNITKDGVFNEIFAKLLSKINEITHLYKNILNKPLNLNDIKDIINTPFEDKIDVANSVNLLTFFKSSGLEFKHVYIPSLTENTFPKAVKSTFFISNEANEIVSSKIRTLSPNFNRLIESDKDGINEEARLFYVGMTRATDSLTISTHKWEDKKQVQPSSFYKLLKDIDSKNYIEVGLNKPDEDGIELEELPINKQAKTKVIDEGSVLRLNPSAVSNFLSCPKKYYFKNLLNLNEESQFAANYGTIVHAVLEVFVKEHIDSYTKETILSLANILFDSKNNSGKAISAGFKQMDIDKVIETDDLSIAEMKENFNDAVNQLELNGFFEKIPSEATTEKSFKFSINELPNVEFDGRIDAICKYEDGYKLIDYKTGKNKEYNLNKLLAFQTNSGKLTKNMEKYLQKYEYQIPIYHLAAKNSGELKDYKDKISELGLLYVRPKSKDDGYKDDFVTSEQAEEHIEEIIQNLKTTVVDEIFKKETFEPKPNYMTCQNCAFNFLCDESEDSDDDN